MRYSLKTFQELTDNTFPFKHFKVISFDGVERPITIICPVHGEQIVSKGSNFIRSKYGCPSCGKSVTEKSLGVFKKTVSILDTATDETLTFPSVQAAAKALNTSYGSIRTKLDGRSNPDNLICNRYKVLL